MSGNSAKWFNVVKPDLALTSGFTFRILSPKLQDKSGTEQNPPAALCFEYRQNEDEEGLEAAPQH